MKAIIALAAPALGAVIGPLELVNPSLYVAQILQELSTSAVQVQTGFSTWSGAPQSLSSIFASCDNFGANIQMATGKLSNVQITVASGELGSAYGYLDNIHRATTGALDLIIGNQNLWQQYNLINPIAQRVTLLQGYMFPFYDTCIYTFPNIYETRIQSMAAEVRQKFEQAQLIYQHAAVTPAGATQEAIVADTVSSNAAMANQGAAAVSEEMAPNAMANEAMAAQQGAALPESMAAQQGAALPESMAAQQGAALPESMAAQQGAALPEAAPEAPQEGAALPEVAPAAAQQGAIQQAAIQQGGLPEVSQPGVVQQGAIQAAGQPGVVQQGAIQATGQPGVVQQGAVQGGAFGKAVEQNANIPSTETSACAN